MTSLVNEIIEAHGGLEVWRQYEQLSAQLTQGGALWHLKGQAGVLDNAKVTVGLKEQLQPHQHLQPGWRQKH